MAETDVCFCSGGCQLQPMPYALQLLHKRNTVKLAYERFSALDQSVVPEIQPTIGSPKQWGYRTKITPHFDAPPKAVRPQLEAIAAARSAEAEQAEGNEEEGMNGHVPSISAVPAVEKPTWECRIGFERKGRPGVLDIEVSKCTPSLASAGWCRTQADLVGMSHCHNRDQ